MKDTAAVICYAAMIETSTKVQDDELHTTSTLVEKSTFGAVEGELRAFFVFVPPVPLLIDFPLAFPVLREDVTTLLNSPSFSEFSESLCSSLFLPCIRFARAEFSSSPLLTVLLSVARKRLPGSKTSLPKLLKDGEGSPRPPEKNSVSVAFLNRRVGLAEEAF
jgi:hypothetical protein